MQLTTCRCVITELRLNRLSRPRTCLLTCEYVMACKHVIICTCARRSCYLIIYSK